jgi:glutaredoxin
VCVVLALPLSCKKSVASDDKTGTVPKATQLPKLTLKDDTPNLLLTWVDDSGDFHVGQHVADVPPASRKQVRVVVTTSTDGTGEQVYVANFDAKRDDGTYAVSTMSRAVWDELGASRRKERLEALAPSAKPIESAAPEGSAAAVGDVVAIVYGASWCGPCHQAQKYLKSRGVKVIFKDVDESPVAQRELRDKLTRASMPPTSSIPVIDIGGQLLVGFSASALDHAIASVHGGGTQL